MIRPHATAGHSHAADHAAVETASVCEYANGSEGSASNTTKEHRREGVATCIIQASERVVPL